MLKYKKKAHQEDGLFFSRDIEAKKSFSNSKHTHI